MSQEKQTIDREALLMLLDASDLLTPDKKDFWRSKLDTLSYEKTVELFRLLFEEAQIRNRMLKDILNTKKIYARKKLQALYAYAEQKLREEEAGELADMHEELQSVIAL